MLIAVISDTHMPRGTRALPASCAERIATADLLIHAGDFSTITTYTELELLGPPLHAVHGNTDDQELRGRLPAERVVEADGVRIAVTHDAGRADGRLERLRRRFPECDAAIFGHSHMPEHGREGDFQIFNPGSPTERRRAPEHTMGIAVVERGSIEFELVVVR